MEAIYATTPPEDIPWNRDVMPEVLNTLIVNREVGPCRALDIGCGTGNHVLRMASLGFHATGIDVSPTAIGLARIKALQWNETRIDDDSAETRGSCRFEVADILDDSDETRELLGTFKFSYGYQVLHHVFPHERELFVRNVHSLLEQGGRHLSVCFSEEDEQFPGEGKVRETQIGTRLYFSSEEEIRELFGKHFQVLDLRTITVPGDGGSHRAVYCFMEKEWDHPEM